MGSYNDQSFVIKDRNKLSEHISFNRRSVKNIESWMPDMQASYFNYGIPDEIKDLIDKPINEEPTYTDLITYFSSRFKEIDYLEMGVSVGKNFLPVTMSIQKGTSTAFDIEDINPILANQFSFVEVKKSWPAPANSIRKRDARLSSFKHYDVTVDYLAADIYDENAWKALAGRKFNVIFSDALHDPKALLFEYQMLLKYDLLAKDFMIFWDDLHGAMLESFKSIAAQIKRKRLFRKTESKLVAVNGWLGQNYPHKHPVGIVSTFKIE